MSLKLCIKVLITLVTIIQAPLLLAESKFSNISTRGFVGNADDVLIGGFIIDSASPKQVLIRARGPSLAQADSNLKGLLNNPLVQLFNSSGTLIDTNDDWQTNSNADSIAAGLRPTEPREAALLVTLNPGAYTAIVRGVAGTTGIGIVEVFDPTARVLDLGGIWNGTSTSKDGLPLQKLSLITTPDGKFAATSITTDAEFIGKFEPDASGAFSASFTAVAADGTQWSNASSTIAVSVVGTFTEQGTISATWTSTTVGANESGTFSFTYDKIYERPSTSPAFTVGTWIEFDKVALDIDTGRPLTEGTRSATFTFSNGFYTTTVGACKAQGQIASRNTKFNMYNASLQLSDCPNAGNFSGLAYIIDTGASGALSENSGLIIMVDDDTNFLSTTIFKF